MPITRIYLAAQLRLFFVSRMSPIQGDDIIQRELRVSPFQALLCLVGRRPPVIGKTKKRLGMTNATLGGTGRHCGRVYERLQE